MESHLADSKSFFFFFFFCSKCVLKRLTRKDFGVSGWILEKDFF